MEAVLDTADAVITALGGPTKAGAKLNRSPQAVWNWGAAGRIPPELFLSVQQRLKEDGQAAAAPEVFGMAVPDEGVEVAS